MSLLEFREMIEGGVPWWTPLVAVLLGLLVYGVGMFEEHRKKGNRK